MCYTRVMKRNVKKLRTTPFSNDWYSKRCQHVKERSMLCNVPFNFNTETMKELYMAINCYYCGDSFIGRTTREIDRLIPEIGYISSNCVMACRDCNRIKGTMKKGDDRLRKIRAVLLKLA